VIDPILAEALLEELLTVTLLALLVPVASTLGNLIFVGDTFRSALPAGVGDALGVGVREEVRDGVGVRAGVCDGVGVRTGVCDGVGVREEDCEGVGVGVGDDDELLAYAYGVGAPCADWFSSAII
jgi:hypothetical protein